MKKRRLLTTITLSLTLLCTTFTIPTFASTSASPTISRMSGQTRYDTASAIAKQGWSQSDYAILAFGENYPDALASAPLAKKYNAPILLTTSGNLPDVTKQTLIGLQTKNVIIVGGTGVISNSIDTELQSMGINVSRVFGNDKYETAIKVAEQVSTTPSSIFICNGDDFGDALSVAPVASIQQSPIILVSSDSIPDSVRTYISSNTNITKSYVIGFSDIISDSIANQFPNPERITGADKYERNVNVDKYFNNVFSSNGAGIATGEGFADALTATAYCAKVAEPLILVNYNSPNTTKSYYQQKMGDQSKVYVFGGTAVVPDSVVQGLGTISSPSVPSTPVSEPTTPTTPVPSNPIPATPTPSTTPTSPSSFTNPYPLNTSQTIGVKSILTNYTAQVSIEQIIRGQEAWTMISKANMFNKAPKSGYEYILAKINLKLLDIDEGKALNLVGNVDFKLVSQSGRSYDNIVFGVAPDPGFDTKLYKGGSSEGWVIFSVKTDDLKPVLSYGTNYDGSGGIWFQAYGDTASTPVNTITPITSTTPITPVTNLNGSTVPTKISDIQDYLNKNFSGLRVNDKEMKFKWVVNSPMIGNTDIQIHAYIGSLAEGDFVSYGNWLKLCMDRKQDVLTGSFSAIFNQIQAAFPDKSIWLSGIYEDYYDKLPTGYKSSEVSYSVEKGKWHIFHQIIAYLDTDGINGVPVYIEHP